MKAINKNRTLQKSITDLLPLVNFDRPMNKNFPGRALERPRNLSIHEALNFSKDQSLANLKLRSTKANNLTQRK